MKRTVRPSDGRAGFALPVVLAVLVMLTLAVYLLMDRTADERLASSKLVQRKQVELAGRSAGDVLLSLVAEDPGFDPRLIESWTMPLFEQASAKGSSGEPRVIEVTFLRTSPEGGLTPGIESENGRLNLNALADADLDEVEANELLVIATAGLIDDEQADLILDLIDDDSESRPLGDESGLSGIPPRNQPLDTLDDLLIIPGITPELLYGEDANRNNLLDATEDDGAVSAPLDNEDGLLDRGLAAVLTVDSREANLTPEGLPRLNLNADDLDTLYSDLQQYAFTTDQLDYLMLARKSGVDLSSTRSSDDEADDGGSPFGAIGLMTDTLPVAFQRGGGGPPGGGFPPGGFPPGGGAGRGSQGMPPAGSGGGNVAEKRLTSMGDVLFPINDEAGTPSPFVDDPDALRLLFDVTALTEAATIAGRIDIDAAGVDVLSGLPGWDASLAASVVAQGGGWLSVADLYNDGLLDAAQFRQSAPLLTVGSRTFRFQAIAFVRDGPAVRYEYVVDASDPAEPRILRQTDLTRLSFGVDRSVFEPAE